MSLTQLILGSYKVSLLHEKLRDSFKTSFSDTSKWGTKAELRFFIKLRLVIGSQRNNDWLRNYNQLAIDSDGAI